MESVYLDPDYRKWPDDSKPYCCRCQKTIKDVTKAVRVSFTDEDRGWHVKRDDNGTNLVGADCAKKIGLITNTR